jgi:hypothetical protein
MFFELSEYSPQSFRAFFDFFSFVDYFPFMTCVTMKVVPAFNHVITTKCIRSLISSAVDAVAKGVDIFGVLMRWWCDVAGSCRFHPKLLGVVRVD